MIIVVVGVIHRKKTAAIEQPWPTLLIRTIKLIKGAIVSRIDRAHCCLLRRWMIVVRVVVRVHLVSRKFEARTAEETTSERLLQVLPELGIEEKVHQTIGGAIRGAQPLRQWRNAEHQVICVL